MDKGSYILILKLEENLEITRPRKITLKPGYYAYIGSGMNSLTGRIKRHLSKDKKIHWHIDQLTTQAEVLAVHMFVGKKIEIELSEFFGKHLKGIKGFGSSDLKTSSNLFYSSSLLRIIELIGAFYKKNKDLA